MKFRWRKEQQILEERRRPLVEVNLLDDHKRKTNPPGRARAPWAAPLLERLSESAKGLRSRSGPRS
jgi:hypothetical protein